MASRYFVTGSGGNANWTQSGAGSNWSLTDGGAGGQTVPSASDDVFFTVNSPSCTSDGAGPNVALTLNFTGYTNTITMTAQINVSGAMTFVAAMTIAGAAYLRSTAAGTHTSNGKTIPNLWLSGLVTHTLADNFTVTNLRLGITSTATVVNGNQITVNGDYDRGQATTGGISGTTVIILAGTGAYTFPTSTGVNQIPLTINTSGTITFPASSTYRHNTGALTYTAGTVVNTSTIDLVIATASTTLSCGSAMQWQDVTIANTLTLTLGADLYCRDFIVSTTGTSTLNGNTFYVSRHLTANSITTSTITGTTIIVMTGTGTISTTAITTGRIAIPLRFNAPGGTITVTSPMHCDLGKFTYTAGAVITDTTWSAASGGGGAPPIGLGSPVIRAAA